MSSIIRNRDTYHGISLDGRGVFKATIGRTFAGQCKGGYACGLGVVTYSDGTTWSGQFAYGRWDGHRETHWADGDVDYDLCERGNRVHRARVKPDGDCEYDYKPCGADHADFAALIAAAQQAGVRMPPTRIHRKARAIGRNRRTRRFGFRTRSILVPGVGPRRAGACGCVCVCG